MISPLATISAASFAVLGGVDNVDAASEHGNGGAFRGQSGFVRSGIDAPRHPGSDREPGARQIARQPLRRGYSVRSGMPGADHPDATASRATPRGRAQKVQAADRRSSAMAPDKGHRRE